MEERERERGWPKSSIGKGFSQSLGMEETGSQKHFFHVFFSDNGSLCTVNSSCSVENASIFFFTDIFQVVGVLSKKKRKKNFELGNYIHTVDFTFHTRFFYCTHHPSFELKYFLSPPHVILKLIIFPVLPLLLFFHFLPHFSSSA